MEAWQDNFINLVETVLNENKKEVVDRVYMMSSRRLNRKLLQLVNTQLNGLFEESDNKNSNTLSSPFETSRVSCKLNNQL